MSTMPGGPFGPPSGIAGARWDDAAIYGLGSGSASSKRDPLSIKDTKSLYNAMKFFLEKGYTIKANFDVKKYKEEIYRKLEEILEKM